MESTFRNIREIIIASEQEVIDLQKHLTRIPAIAPENGGQGEKEKCDWLKKILKTFNPDQIEEIPVPDTRVSCGYRPNLVVRWKGRSREKTVWIMSHMDVVPPGDRALWRSDPFEAVVADGKVFGRGTEDNHQGIVSSILSIKAVLLNGLSPSHDMGLLFVADEETGSRYGIEAVLRSHGHLFRKEDVILIPDAGDPEGRLIEIAEKSILWIRCETQGHETHGSTPEKGANAHKAAAHLIVRMEELYGLYPKKDPMFDPPISTFEPTKKEANVETINTIPGKDVVYFDCRVLPDYSLEEIIDRIRTWADEIEKRFGVTLSLSFPQKQIAPPATPPRAPSVIALQRAIREVTGKEPRTIGIGGGTVAAFFRKAGYHPVCWCTVDDTLHAPNEYSVIANTLTDAAVFAHVFLQE